MKKSASTSSRSHLIVAKFGGTSVATSKNLKRCANIVLNNPEIKIVVVSATAGTTNDLVSLCSLAQDGKWHECQRILSKIKNKHLIMANELGAELPLIQQIQTLLEKLFNLVQGMCLLSEVSLRGRDQILSFGERISSLLFTLALEKYCLGHRLRPLCFDVRKVLRTDEHFSQAQAKIDQIAMLCKEHLLPLLEEGDDEGKYDVVVTQGFIGSTEKGETTTLGRGGSDFSAALLAEALEAKALHIWTDVPGISTMDPRIIPEASILSELTYNEAAELANLGAKVLHPLTLIPMMRKGIPVFVGSTFHLDQKGTWIRQETASMPGPRQSRPSSKPSMPIRALAYRPNQGVLTLSKIKAPDAYGFLAQVFQVFTRYRISIDLVSTSEISTAVTLHDPSLLGQELLAELGQLADIQWENQLGLVSVIGPDLLSPAGLYHRIFETIQEYPIRFICMGSGKNNLSFLVQEAHALPILQKLHQRFLAKKKEAPPSLKKIKKGDHGLPLNQLKTYS